jgi:methyl-accepting chemotaxis protein
MSKQPKKILTTYVKFSLDTFQGRMTSGFFFVGFIVLILVFYPVLVYRATIERYESLLKQSIPIKYYCSVMETMLAKSTLALQHSLLTQDYYYQTERKRLWQEDYKAAMDSLLHYTNLGGNLKTSSLVYNLIVETNQLRAKQEFVYKEYFTAEGRPVQPDEQNTADKQLLNRKEYAQKLADLQDNALLNLQLIVQEQNDILIKTNAEVHADLQNVPRVSILLTVVVLIAAFIVGYFVITFVLRKIKFLKNKLEQLDDGYLPESIIIGKDELSPIATALNQLIHHLQEVRHFALQVGQGNFDREFKAFDSESDLGSALVQMRESLKSVSQEEKKRAWAVNGLAHFSALLRDNSQNLSQLCEVVIQELVRYIDAQQGGIYAVADKGTQKQLVLLAWYAFERKKYKEKTVEIGEGVLGEAFREKKTVYMKKVPENYLKITSGLGEAEPSCLLIVPLKVNEEMEGIIEIASFKLLSLHQIEFIEKICESIASTIISVKINEKTKQLLENAQLSSEMMRAQEEEMRQNVEELQATQEALHRKESELAELLQQAQLREQKLLHRIRQLENGSNEMDL